MSESQDPSPASPVVPSEQDTTPMPSEKVLMRQSIAENTLATIDRGSYTLNDVSYDLAVSVDLSKQGTLYYAPDSSLSDWSSTPITTTTNTNTNTTQSPDVEVEVNVEVNVNVSPEISILEISTLEGARNMASSHPPTTNSSSSSSPSSDKRKTGILNFASAKNPGGGFLRGAQAQEESIARSSTLYPTLMTETAQQFYELHRDDPKGGYYSHAMIYSPDIIVFCDDRGELTEPTEVDVLTSPAVNAGLVRKRLRATVEDEDGEVDVETREAEEAKIEEVMRERMARILYLFELQGVQDIVLGSFGTGVFRNDVGMVARIWADLLVMENARFKSSFDRVVFAILGKATINKFITAFGQHTSPVEQL